MALLLRDLLQIIAPLSLILVVAVPTVQAQNVRTRPLGPSMLSRDPIPGKEDEVIVERDERGYKIDYYTIIRHPNGTTTTVEDVGDVIIVEGARNQTVGRNATHREVLRTNYRPEQGDVIISIFSVNPDGSLSVRFDRENYLERQASTRAANEAFREQEKREPSAVQEALLQRPPQAGGTTPERDLSRPSGGEGSNGARDVTRGGVDVSGRGQDTARSRPDVDVSGRGQETVRPK